MSSRPKEPRLLPPLRACVQHSHSAIGDELLQRGQVELTLHSLGLCQCAHVQGDDVLGQHLGVTGNTGSAYRPSQAWAPRQRRAGGAPSNGEEGAPLSVGAVSC